MTRKLTTTFHLQYISMGTLKKHFRIFATLLIQATCQILVIANTNQDFVLENYSLQASSYNRIYAPTLSTCTKICLQHTRCFSINYSPSSGCCELNHRGIGNSEHCDANLLFSLGCIYRQVKSTHSTGKVSRKLICFYFNLWLAFKDWGSDKV